MNILIPDHVPNAEGPKARALIRVRLAKTKLYEAKVGIVVAQKRWDKHGWGKDF